MTYKENITAILECYFTGFKKEIIDSACDRILEQEAFMNKPCVAHQVCHEDKVKVLGKIKAEIEAKIEEEEFARSVFRHEEIDVVKAEQCTGSIIAYNNVIKFIDKYIGK